jgi:hypothetical protein
MYCKKRSCAWAGWVTDAEKRVLDRVRRRIDPVCGDDLTVEFEEIADFLYGLPAEEFTAARDARSSAAAKDGNADLAKALKLLRRPTAGAWLANILVADQRSVVEELVELGSGMRRAQESLAGADLRRLSQERRKLIDLLRAEAIRAANKRGTRPTGSALQELTETLESVLADPAAAGSVMSGRLTSSLRYSGFGPSVSGDAARPAKRSPSRNTGKQQPDAIKAGAGKTSSGKASAGKVGTEHTELKRRLVSELATTQREVDARRKELLKAHKTLDQIRTRLEATEDLARSLRDQVRTDQRSLKDAERALVAAQRRLREASDRVVSVEDDGE